MLVLPVYDLLLLPGVTFYFKKDILDRMQSRKRRGNSVFNSEIRKTPGRSDGG